MTKGRERRKGEKEIQKTCVEGFYVEQRSGIGWANTQRARVKLKTEIKSVR